MQKRSREGFTLIELLAVIVILSIIALIAVPVIMNVITKARISAFEDSAYGIVKAGELYYSNQLLEPEGMTEDQEFTVVNGIFKNTKSTDTLDISGSLPSSGKVTVTKEGKVALAISNGEYYIQKSTVDSEIKARSLKDDNITEEKIDYKKTVNTIFTTASDGTTVPVCITNNTECSAGTKVGIKVNNTDAPIDFYVISDSVENGEIILIMDKNLGETVAWAEDDNSKGPLVALKALEDRTSNWTNIPLKTYTLTDDNDTPLYSPITRTARARLITKSEATALGCINKSDGSCQPWLYANTFNNGDNTNYGHWTSSASAGTSINVWYVRYGGSIGGTTINVSHSAGVRPVITVPKNIII